MQRVIRAAAAILAAAGIGATAAASASGPGMTGKACDHAGAGGALKSSGYCPQEMEGGPQARVDARLAALEEGLDLTDEQQPAWRAFEQAIRSRASACKTDAAAAAQADPLQARIAELETQLSGMKAVAKAREDLIAVLTPEQKAMMAGFPGRH